MVNALVTIATPATATAPKGRIIDDSSRGTIFWEAENHPTVEADSTTLEVEDHSGNASSAMSTVSAAPSTHAGSVTPQMFGKPFKIVWLSTNRVPFYRTKGIRNPWNANREVKIARDGTEIEPSVGSQLISMFGQPCQPPTPPPPPMRPGMEGRYGTGWYDGSWARTKIL